MSEWALDIPTNDLKVRVKTQLVDPSELPIPGNRSIKY